MKVGGDTARWGLSSEGSLRHSGRGGNRSAARPLPDSQAQRPHKPLLQCFSQLPKRLPPKAVPSGAKERKTRVSHFDKTRPNRSRENYCNQSHSMALARRGKKICKIMLTLSSFSPPSPKFYLSGVLLNILKLFKILPEAGTQRRNIPAYKQRGKFHARD